ncbi:2-C-methyl-D-erythritol 4-phosphate cytidylyltransferase [Marinomonas ostreistagni]|uniref:2-C-methyl-D-erythritol 4-phosphate cytidylyltransferase n=1 Tax=Marinomonas ostreistagni TaxID=359209 RepID=A0ABS0Z6R1_9GAMM|nr:2-C-methyl-D-erythritol 4-phosphate cytidylyltransferase [Marinomonas ostreistagni]MBJ7549349.1 2-C-methyl-D-erythritol 4-phosphate cytidylyltransferase [Marinomonas ostreistagni]
MTQFWVIIPAAGVGKRMASTQPKQYLMLNGKTILDTTIEKFLEHPQIAGIAVGVSPDDEYWKQSEWAGNPQVVRFDGGQERSETVLNGLQVLMAIGVADDESVLVHDAARPLVTEAALTRIMAHTGEQGALLAIPCKDTLKLAEEKRSTATVDRSVIWQAQTPQKFPLMALYQGIAAAMEEGIAITDESSAMELIGWQPDLVEGESCNLKITVPEDLVIAQALLSLQPTANS